MKKFAILLAVVFTLSFLAGLCWGNALLKVSDIQTSNDWIIKNVTLGTAETIGSTTLSEGAAVSINIKARGNAVYWVKGGTITEAAWEIPQNAVWSDHLTIPFPINTVLYFYAASVPTTVEVWYNYR